MIEHGKLLAIIVSLCIFWNDINIVKCAEELKFWEPMSEFEGRRAHNKRSERSKIRNVSRNDQKFRYGRGKSRNSSLNLPAQEIIGHHIRHSREHDDVYNQFRKIQHPKIIRNNRRNTYISTRITPMYLMQEMGDSTTNTTRKPEHKDAVDSENELSPYGFYEQMKRMTSAFPEANITIEVIGRTAEYNDIVLLKMTEHKSEISRFFRAEDDKYIEEAPEKKIIFIVHGLSVMGIKYLPCLISEYHFKTLLSYYISYLDKFDIFLIPMANPDGIRARSNLWNKNMSPQNACLGVSLDRNFDIAWNSSRVISSCSQQYPGPTPFSEPETRAIRDVFHHFSHKIMAYFHVHASSYSTDVFKGDAVLYPKGYSDVISDDDKYVDIKGEIDEALKNASFKLMSVTVEPLHNWYGKVAGTSVDYASTVYGIPFAMEWVMQIYEDSIIKPRVTQGLPHISLIEIWQRVIDITFQTIWKHTHSNDNNV